MRGRRRRLKLHRREGARLARLLAWAVFWLLFVWGGCVLLAWAAASLKARW